MKALALIAVAATAAHADPKPLEPSALPAIAIKEGGKGRKVVVFASGAPRDALVHALAYEGYVMAADSTPITGRISEPGAPWDHAVDAIAGGVTVLRVPAAVRGHKTIELDFITWRMRDLVRVCADTANAGYVIASAHGFPMISLRTKPTDPLEVAKAMAKVAGLEMKQVKGVWLFVEPGTKLDDKLVAKAGEARVELHRATPGEARHLLDPKLAPADDLCPPAATIDAAVPANGVGALRAVLATFHGPACDPPSGPLRETSTLIGTLGDKRAVVRLDKGSNVYDGKVSSDAAEIAGVTVRLSSPVLPPPLRGPFLDKDAGAHWKLRALVGLEARTWSAIFVSDTGDARFVRRGDGGKPLGDPTNDPIDIDATHAWTATRSYVLAR